jgi:hypothetical protein
MASELKIDRLYRYLVLKSMMYLLANITGDGARRLQDEIQSFIDRHLVN